MEGQIGGILYQLTEQIFLKEGRHDLHSACYGAEYETDVFMMHPYCWCQRDECPWCRAEDPMPNFWYKPTDFRVWWYKYIGRDMVCKGNYPHDMYVKCFESIWPKGSDENCWYLLLEKSDIVAKLVLCFNVYDTGSKVEGEIPLMTWFGWLFGWDFDALFSGLLDGLPLSYNDEELIKRVEELNRQYPNLRRLIAKRATEWHFSMIEWHEKWINEIKQNVLKGDLQDVTPSMYLFGAEDLTDDSE